MATIVEGIFQGELPWLLIISGGMIALAIELLGIGSLPVAIGLYLPLSLSTPIMAGGVLAWLVTNASAQGVRKLKQEHGVLFGSGLVAGDGLMGVLIAFIIAGFPGYRQFYDAHVGGMVSGLSGDLLSLAAFAGLMAMFWIVIQRQSSSGRGASQ
jgi:hypothetical protein